MPSEPPVVVIADPIDPGAVDRLRSSGRCRVVDVSTHPERLPEELRSAWGVVVRSRTKLGADVLAGAPGLRAIARAGVGIDNVDVPYATRRGIAVFNAPGAASASVAELTVLFLLMLAREFPGPIADTKAGRWPKGGNTGELLGKTVGLVGYGRIAREVAKRLRPFGVTVLAFDPFVRSVDDGSRLVGLDELLAASDFVSLHAALTPENHHLLDAARLGRAKRGLRIVNVARGALLDEAALLDALASGQVGGAALDVFEAEPPTRAELLAHPRVIATPHLGASTREGQARAGAQVVDDLLRVLSGQAPSSPVNPEVKVPAP